MHRRKKDVPACQARDVSKLRGIGLARLEHGFVDCFRLRQRLDP